MLSTRREFVSLSFSPSNVCVYLVIQLSPTLSDPTDVVCQAPLSMGILQTRILEWVAMSSTRGSFQPRDWTQVSDIADGFLPTKAPGKIKNTRMDRLFLLQGSFWPMSQIEVFCIAGRFFTSWVTREACLLEGSHIYWLGDSFSIFRDSSVASSKLLLHFHHHHVSLSDFGPSILLLDSPR